MNARVCLKRVCVLCVVDCVVLYAWCSCFRCVCVFVGVAAKVAVCFVRGVLCDVAWFVCQCLRSCVCVVVRVVFNVFVCVFCVRDVLCDAVWCVVCSVYLWVVFVVSLCVSFVIYCAELYEMVLCLCVCVSVCVCFMCLCVFVSYCVMLCGSVVARYVFVCACMSCCGLHMFVCFVCELLCDDVSCLFVCVFVNGLCVVCLCVLSLTNLFGGMHH